MSRSIRFASWATVVAIIAIAGVFSATAFAAPPTIKITTPTPANAVVPVPEQMDILQLQPPHTLEGETQHKELGLPNNEGLKPNSPNFDVYLTSAEGREWMHYRTVHVTVVSHSMNDAHVNITFTYRVGKQTYPLRVLASSPSSIKKGDYGPSGLTIKSPLMGASIRTAAITTLHDDACIVVKTAITFNRTKESAAKESQICWGKKY